MFETLKGIKQVRKEKKEIEDLIKQAIETKKKSIESKERLLELMDMIIINRVNMVEEIQFVEKRQEISKTVSSNTRSSLLSKADRLECDTQMHKSLSVSDLVRFFDKYAQTEDQKRLHHSTNKPKTQQPSK